VKRRGESSIETTVWRKEIGGYGGDEEMGFFEIKSSFSSPYLLRIPLSPFKK
jgi:hypothetical protein